jgi:hypothetical protein
MRNVRENRFGVFQIAVSVPLATLVTTVHSETFISGAKSERFTLTCDGQQVLDTPCFITINSSGATPVRFSTGSTHYAHLLKQGMEKALDEKQQRLRPTDSDISLLKGLSLEQCHPAKESNGISGDLLQLCVVSSSSSVVLFMRGLCDRCVFQPLVLTRQNQ